MGGMSDDDGNIDGNDSSVAVSSMRVKRYSPGLMR